MRPRMLDSAQQELQTLRDLLRYTVTQFNASKLSFGHGNDSAWDEAVYLLLHTLHLPLDTLDPFLDARVLPEEREQIGRAHVCTPVTNEHLVCRLLLDKKHSTNT